MKYFPASVINAKAKYVQYQPAYNSPTLISGNMVNDTTTSLINKVSRGSRNGLIFPLMYAPPNNAIAPTGVKSVSGPTPENEASLNTATITIKSNKTVVRGLIEDVDISFII